MDDDHPGPGRAATGIAGAVGLIAVVTVAARIAGFGRTVVFVRSVGAGCVGSVYTTVNTLPNIVFDVVAGGMLAAIVVPVLAPALAAGDRDRAQQAFGALLGRALVATAVVAVLIAALAPWLVRLLLGASVCPGADGLGTRMLLVFAPQVLFYGLGAVLGGALQAGHRFGWPAAAPLLSSLVVIAAYLVYGATVAGAPDAAGLPVRSELTLSVGTTAGVVVLAGCLVLPLRRTGLRLRPGWRFPAGLGRVAGRTAVAGAAALAAQQLATAVMLRLANGTATAGLAVVVTTAQTVFLLPWAVLAVPVATAGYPRLATAWDAGDRTRFAGLLDGATRTVTAAAAVATAVLVAVAQSGGELLLSGARSGTGAQQQFAPTLAAFAAGLLGWSLVAVLARALYAAGRARAAGVGQVVGQVAVVVADVAFAALLPAERRGLALGLGNTVGVTVAGALLLAAVLRVESDRLRVAPAFAVLTRTAVVAGAAGTLGWLLGRRATGDGPAGAAGWGLAAGVVAAAVAAGLALALDPALRTLAVARVRRSRR